MVGTNATKTKRLIMNLDYAPAIQNVCRKWFNWIWKSSMLERTQMDGCSGCLDEMIATWVNSQDSQDRENSDGWMFSKPRWSICLTTWLGTKITMRCNIVVSHTIKLHARTGNMCG